MKILMYSWEYPPKKAGGLAQHVYDLTKALAKAGHEIHLITVGDNSLPMYEEVEDVKVHRVRPYDLNAFDFQTWILQLNVAMLEYTITLFDTVKEDFDIIHNHDWLTAYAARAIKHAKGLPLVATIHATESGRNNGLHNDLQRYISNVEWWLTYEAWRVIVCSYYMEDEMRRVFQLPKDKMAIIPNGVNPKDFKTTKEIPNFRLNYAAPDEKIVYFVGRLVQEKGVQVLLDAIPKILHYHPKTKFVVAGKGPNEGYLRHKAFEMGIANRVYFTGFVDDETRNQLYKAADVAVVPSLYEPFGIVALEAMAAETPVVVSDTGGLSEIIVHQQNGLKSYTGSANSVADNVLNFLCDPSFADKTKNKAYRDVLEIYNWDKIAKETVDVFAQVLQENSSKEWQRATPEFMLNNPGRARYEYQRTH